MAAPTVPAETGGEPQPDPAATGPAPAPTTADGLTDEQRQIQDLQDQLAKLKGKQDVEPEYEPAPADAGDTIVIHFLEDGLAALGTIWYRGQEVEFAVGSRAHRDTFDRRGRSWLDLRNDEFAQVERWGKVMFRPGPWPGKKLTEVKPTFETVRNADGSPVPAPTEEELAKAHDAELRRRRAAPRLQPLG